MGWSLQLFFAALLFIVVLVVLIKLGVSNRLLRQEIQKKKEAEDYRKQLEKEILEISDREQKRMGQDLHDGLGQHLTGIAFMSKSLSHILEHKGIAESNNALEISKLINEGIAQCKALARGLYPVELEENGLVSALEEMVHNIDSFYNIKCSLLYGIVPQFMDRSVELHLYRIVQEAVNNAIKHGGAKNIDIIFSDYQKNYELKIRDDGQGMSDSIVNKKGMGLNIMHYRAGMIGAHLKIKSCAEKGTEVICTLAR